MRVIDQDTGKYCHLDVTAELKADLARHDAAACKHLEREVRQRLRSNGALHLYEQCLSCGASVGMALKRSPEFANAPAWNEGREEQHKAAREAEREDIIQKHVRIQKTGAAGFKREYDVYLSGAEWQAKRAKVLRRANGICEGCLERKATQVHHLTYEHVKHEFMFELVAVCDECHARLHADEAEPCEFKDGHPCDGCRWASENGEWWWCSASEQRAADALAPDGGCGPERARFAPLK